MGLIFMDMLMYIHVYVSVRMLLCVEDVYIHTCISVLQLCRSTRLFVSYTLWNSLLRLAWGEFVGNNFLDLQICDLRWHKMDCCSDFETRILWWTRAFFDGYCSAVQGLLDWFEVDLGFTELSFTQIDLCVLCVFVLYSCVSLSSCPLSNKLLTLNFFDRLFCKRDLQVESEQLSWEWAAHWATKALSTKAKWSAAHSQLHRSGAMCQRRRVLPDHGCPLWGGCDN